MSKIYLVGQMAYDRVQGEGPNFDNFPVRFFDALEEAVETYEQFKKYNKNTQHTVHTAYLAEVETGPRAKVTVLEGKMDFY